MARRRNRRKRHHSLSAAEAISKLPAKALPLGLAILIDKLDIINGRFSR